MTNILVAKPRVSLKKQSVMALIGAGAAVLLPQLFHAIGVLSGTGAALGAAFLPMYLPVVLVGLLAGPLAGAAAGLIAPLASFAISGMPTAAVLPVIAAEVFACGLFAGLFRNVKMPVALKVLAVLCLAKVCRAAATLLLVYVVGSEAVAISSIWMSAVQSLPGILLQLVLVPLAVFYAENRK